MRTSASRGFVLVLLIAVALWSASCTHQSVEPTPPRPIRTLTCTFDDSPPYVLLESHDGFERKTGLDTRLLRLVGRHAGLEIDFRYVESRDQLDALQKGKVDLAMNVSEDVFPSSSVYYSDTYRVATDVIYTRAGEAGRCDFDSVPAMLKNFEATGFRLGIEEGTWHGPLIDAYVKKMGKPYVLLLPGTPELFQALGDNRIDGLIVERLEGAHLTAHFHWWDLSFDVSNLTIYETGIRMAFSRKTVGKDVVASVNQALQAVRETGEYVQIANKYRLEELNVLLSGMTHQTWFFVVDVLGAFAFAISGVVLAHRGGYSIAGALLLAALPTVGGGVIRDVMVDRHPIAVLSSPMYMIIIFITVIVGYLIGHGRFSSASSADSWPAVRFFDTLGLSAYILVGVKVAVETTCTPLWLWGPVLAAITGAGGGIVRDIICINRPDALRRDFLAEVALIWGLILSLFLEWYSRQLQFEIWPLQAAFAFCLVGGFLTRWLYLTRGWRAPSY